MTSNKEIRTVDKTKRKILVGAAAGTATAIWHKPAIDSILLPAHAQTSVATTVFFSSAAAVLPIAKTNSLMDLLVDSAYAGTALPTYEYAAMVEQSAPGSDSYMVSLFERTLDGMTNSGEVLYSGVVSRASGGSIAPVEDPCLLNPRALSVSIDNVDESQVELSLPSRSQRLVIPAGSGSLPTPMCVDTGLPESFYNPEAPIFGRMQSKANLLDLLIPTAHAGQSGMSRTLALLATKIDEDRYTLGMLSVDRTTLREGIVRVDGTEGTLVRVSSTCDDPEKGSTPVPATIISVDASTMVLSLTLDGSPTQVELPVGAGMLNPSSCEPEGNFTNSGGLGGPLLPVGKVQPDSLGERLLDAVIPTAHAGFSMGGSASQYLREQTIINASSNGNGTFDVEIGLSESYIDRDDLGNTIGSVLIGTLTLNAGSFTDIRAVVAGCNESIEARLSSDGPNSLRIELRAIEVAEADFFLSPGTTPISMPQGCFYD